MCHHHQSLVHPGVHVRSLEGDLGEGRSPLLVPVAAPPAPGPGDDFHSEEEARGRLQMV